ncbi:myosin-11 [Iris pallida]|uniref:Myosin-11 n=1 Tax=Iris pallida TaxID=29817 RepID=A0AAX6GCD1_IRIPA|nr:myosin-11 [Iris pallida]KAJ6826416.1 myosin-11 [Iris pallida]
MVTETIPSTGALVQTADVGERLGGATSSAMAPLEPPVREESSADMPEIRPQAQAEETPRDDASIELPHSEEPMKAASSSTTAPQEQTTRVAEGMSSEPAPVTTPSVLAATITPAATPIVETPNTSITNRLVINSYVNAFYSILKPMVENENTPFSKVRKSVKYLINGIRDHGDEAQAVYLEHILNELEEMKTVIKNLSSGDVDLLIEEEYQNLAREAEQKKKDFEAFLSTFAKYSADIETQIEESSSKLETHEVEISETDEEILKIKEEIAKLQAQLASAEQKKEEKVSLSKETAEHLAELKHQKELSTKAHNEELNVRTANLQSFDLESARNQIRQRILNSRNERIATLKMRIAELSTNPSE